MEVLSTVQTWNESMIPEDLINPHPYSVTGRAHVCPAVTACLAGGPLGMPWPPAATHMPQTWKWPGETGLIPAALEAKGLGATAKGKPSIDLGLEWMGRARPGLSQPGTWQLWFVRAPGVLLAGAVGVNSLSCSQLCN